MVNYIISDMMPASFHASESSRQDPRFTGEINPALNEVKLLNRINISEFGGNSPNIAVQPDNRPKPHRALKPIIQILEPFINRGDNGLACEHCGPALLG